MSQKVNKRMRCRVAHEAARIILEEGVRDYQLAKRKAVDRIGANDRVPLPRNLEIEQAIRERQQLFFTEEDYSHQSALWRAALAAMTFLRTFSPRLVGEVLRGTAGKHSLVNLHVFADAAEEVLFQFLNAGIPYQCAERRIRFKNEVKSYPSVHYLETEIEIEIVVFPPEKLRQAPISAIDGKPMQRAEISVVKRKVATLSAYA